MRRIRLVLTVVLIMAAMVLAIAIPALADKPKDVGPEGWGNPFSPTPFDTPQQCHGSVASHPDYCRPFGMKKG
jgi:hypothetical protein